MSRLLPSVAFPLFQGHNGAKPGALPLSAGAAWANPFADVEPGDWFYSAVEHVNTEGLFNGTAEDRFSPGSPMTRGMFVTVLGKFAQADTEPYGEPAFQDVPAGAYYAPYVGWAATSPAIRRPSGNSPTGEASPPMPRSPWPGP